MAESEQTQKAREMKAFAEKLRTTRMGVTLAKNIFTNPEGINAKEAVKILRTLGADIPENLNWTVDALQIYLSGQAIYTGVQAINTAKAVGDAASVNNATNATGAAVMALTALAENNNMLGSDEASIARIGTSVAMIVSSFGANVGAWVALASELASIGPRKQALADFQAFENARASYTATMSSQMQVLTSAFSDYQNKKINLYNLISKAAFEAPHMWPQLVNPDSELVKVFPELTMLPVIGDKFRGHGYSWIGGTIPFTGKDYIIQSWSSDYEIPATRLDNSNKELLAQWLFQAILKPWIINYAVANNEIVGRGNMSMSSIAILSYLSNGNSAYISDTEDYVQQLIASMLTPYDFNDPILDSLGYEYVKSNYKPEQRTFKELGVSFGYENQDFGKYNADVLKMYHLIERTKKSSKIEELVLIEPIYTKLKSYMDFEETSFEKNPQIFKKLSYLNVDFSKARAWREIGNYFAVLNMIEQFRTDPYLSKTKYVQELAPFLPSLTIFDEKFKKIQAISYARLVNELAMYKIAEFTGINRNKLLKLTSDSYQGPAKFTSKG